MNNYPRGGLQASGHVRGDLGLVLPGLFVVVLSLCLLDKSEKKIAVTRISGPPGKIDIRVGYTRKSQRARGLVRIRRQPPKL